MKVVQIRNMPDETHRGLKQRAARERTSLSDLLLCAAERLAAQPTAEEMTERLRNLPAPERPLGDEWITEAIRERRGPLDG